MKKLALISFIILILVGSQVSAEVIRDSKFYSQDNLEEMEHEFFDNGIITSTPDDDESDAEYDKYYQSYTGGNGGAGTSRAMPLFKKFRIKLQNRYRIKEHEEQLKLQEQQEKELKALNKQVEDAVMSDEDVDELINRSLRTTYYDENGNEIKISTLQRFKNFFKRNKAKISEKKSAEKEKTETIKSDDDSDKDKLLAGGVREVVAEKDMVLDCDRLNYDDESSELEAIGNPVMSFPPQGVTIKAKRITYNTESNIIKAYDDVEIMKNGDVITGDYIMINLNDESSIVNNMSTVKTNLLVNAKDVVASEDAIELKEGFMEGEQHYIIELKSLMAGTMLENHEIPEEDRSSFSKDGLEIKVKAKDVFVTAKKKHNVYTVKNADIYYKDNYLTHLGSLSIHTNKDNQYFEANYPEFGNQPRIGMYIGPGFVFDVPNGAIIKAIPFLNYKDKWGIGGALKYRSGTNYTEVFYGTSLGNFVARGRQSLDDRLYIQYGVNSYLDEWFLGSSLAKYKVEAVYNDSTTVTNTLGAGRNATFRQRVAAGYLQDTNFSRSGENVGGGSLGTTRLKYMAELAQVLYSYRNKQKNANFSLSWIMQGSAAVYGTGDTQFIGRMGPFVHSQYKRWSQDIGYLLSSYDDHTPVPKADIYRLGRSSVFFRESLRLNKYFTLSWLGSAALSNDAPNDKLFQENGFYLSVGPDDLKVILGYDFIRERTYLMFSTALDMKGSRVDYKRMVIKNPERLSKSDEEKVVPVSFEKAPAKVVRTNAQVIEIEDPDREQL